MNVPTWSFRGLAGVLAFSLLPVGGCGINLLSPQEEVRLGEQHAPQFIEQAGGEIPNESVRGYVTELGMRIVERVDDETRRQFPWEFYALNTEVINAFALPGGKVFVTRGLMERMENEAQLVGVLGHEVGHVVGEHIGQRMSQQLGIEVGLGVLGVLSEEQWMQVVSGVGEVGGQLYLLSFGRGQELESDDYGIRYLVELGYDPVAMIQLQQVLAEAGGPGAMPEFFSTHPHPDSRIEQAQQLIRDRYPHTQNNPDFVFNREEYQRRVLEPLAELPPAEPAPTPEEEPAPEPGGSRFRPGGR